MEKVIILNATELGYQVIRALGIHGIKSIVIYDQEKDEIGRYSRYVKEAIKIPHFIEEPERLLQLLLGRKEEWRGTLIIPTKDYGVEFLAANKGVLSPHYLIPTPDPGVISTMINKKSLYAFASRIGIAVPRVFYPGSLAELEEAKGHLSFPCLIKPALGHLFFRRFDCKMLEAKNYDELLTRCKNLTDDFHDDSFQLMISEIIPGSDSTQMIQYVSYLDRSGAMLASMASRKIRQDPPQFGQGRIIKSIHNHEVDEQSRTLLSKLGYYGFSEIEWKHDPRDGTYKLIEINPRFIFYIGLCVRCGINFPYIQYCDIVRNEKISCNSYEENVYWIHLYKDILHTLLNHKLEDVSLGGYITPYVSKHTFAVLNLKDPQPFYHQWKQHLGAMLSKWYSHDRMQP